MIVTIEDKSRSCPGVESTINLVEDVLRKDNVLFSAGELIHNSREIERLTGMGLRSISPGDFKSDSRNKAFNNACFLIRTHGESEEVVQNARDCGLRIIDSTCSIVRHSQKIVDQHVRKGWGIVIAGTPDHPEVKGLLARTKGCGVVVSCKKEAVKQELEARSILLAQSTIDADLFSEIRRVLSSKLSGIKIFDTTCRFIRNRQEEVKRFAVGQDVILVVGGNNSANCQLLFNAVQSVNEPSYKVESHSEVDMKLFKQVERVGIVGGASTPRWQLEEMKAFLENHSRRKNPKGLKNRKGGKFSCWMRKNRKKMA